MPVDRLTAEGVGDELRRLYGALERDLAAGTARRLARGIEQPDWAAQKLAAAGELRRWVEGLVRRTSGRGAQDARDAVEAAFARGGAAAERALAGRQFRRPRQQAAVREAFPGTGNINALASSLAGRLEATGPRVVRSVVDAYRATVSAGAASVLGGATARREAAQGVWNRLLDQGFTGFTDVRGRRWSLAGYVDMATRTTTAQAAVQGQLDRQADLGLDLVIVSNAPQECPRCRPWEGKILTRDESGRGGRSLQVEHAVEDRNITVHAAGSVSEAIADGLLHPNCRHSLSAYLPGLTVAPTHTADPEGNAARVRLRELERRARAARLQEAGALTPEGKAAAQARLRATQAEIRQHVEDTKHLGIKRKPERERLELGNVRKGSAPQGTQRAPSPPPAPRPQPQPAPQPEPAAPPAPAPAAPTMPTHLSLPPAGTRERALAEQLLHDQLGIVPSAVQRLAGVRTATRQEVEDIERQVGRKGVAAFYAPAGREIVIGDHAFEPEMITVWRDSVDAKWFVQCGKDHLGARGAGAHEFGHHMDYQVLRKAPSAVQEAFWGSVADALGLRRLGAFESVEDWVYTHRAVITEKISEYGATDADEFLAEIWHEYSTNAHPRPHIKIIGDALRKISEG